MCVFKGNNDGRKMSISIKKQNEKNKRLVFAQSKQIRCPNRGQINSRYGVMRSVNHFANPQTSIGWSPE